MIDLNELMKRTKFSLRFKDFQAQVVEAFGPDAVDLATMKLGWEAHKIVRSNQYADRKARRRWIEGKREERRVANEAFLEQELVKETARKIARCESAAYKEDLKRAKQKRAKLF